jgi:hypothetical protein
MGQGATHGHREPNRRKPLGKAQLGRTIPFRYQDRDLEGTLLQIFPACIRVEADLGSGWPYRVWLGREEVGKPGPRAATPLPLPVTLRRGLLHTLDERGFTQLLANSLSLGLEEKQRVVRALPSLSQFQVDELTKVWQDEDQVFGHLWPAEAESIRVLEGPQRREWEELVRGIRYQSASGDLFAQLEKAGGGR